MPEQSTQIPSCDRCKYICVAQSLYNPRISHRFCGHKMAPAIRNWDSGKYFCVFYQTPPPLLEEEA